MHPSIFRVEALAPQSPVHLLDKEIVAFKNNIFLMKFGFYVVSLLNSGFFDELIFYFCLFKFQKSLTVMPNALIDITAKNAAVYTKFQFERTGFFSVDPDSSGGKVNLSASQTSRNRVEKRYHDFM